MFTYGPQVWRGEHIGLLVRRRKWHVAEYNRIIASRDQLPSELAREALTQHKAAIGEIDALLDKQEPAWGPEREITEHYAEFQHPEALAQRQP